MKSTVNRCTAVTWGLLLSCPWQVWLNINGLLLSSAEVLADEKLSFIVQIAPTTGWQA